MMDKVGESYHGMITAVTSFGVFVELKEIFVEGLIHITNLPKDYYKFNPITHRLSGEHNGLVFQLGDAVHIKVAAVNLDERKVDFEFVQFDDKEQNIRLNKARKNIEQGIDVRKPRKKPGKKTHERSKTNEEQQGAAPKTKVKKTADEIKEAKKKKRKDKRKKQRANAKRRKRAKQAETKD